MNAPGQDDRFSNMAISQAQKEVLRKQLEVLADKADSPAVKEMARDVLAGKTDLRAAMLGHRYEEALNNEMRTFSTWYRGLSDEEKAEQEQRGTAYEEEVRQEAAAKQFAGRRPRPSVEDDEWEEPTILRKRQR